MRAWLMHRTFVEALECLLLTKFLMTVKPTSSGSLEELSSSIESIPTDLKIDEAFQKCCEKLGDLCKTTQFCLLHMNLTNYQILAHISI